MIKTLLAICTVFIFTIAHADSFEDYKNQSVGEFESSKQEFSAYKREIDKSFEAYKRIIDEEFQAYKAEISKYWDTTDVSTNTKWVEYLNNYQIRKTVDFDKQEIKIDVIGGTPEDIKPVLIDLLQEDKGNAFRRDPVAYNTEKRLREKVPELATAKVQDEPIIAPLFSDNTLSDKELNTLADKLIENSETTNNLVVNTDKPYVSMTIKLPQDSYKKAAARVSNHVKKYSDKFDVEPALVMSVIYNESRFNPLAKSYVPAYGLMQIVPKSAGLDAILFLEGKKRILAPSYLYDAENNVKIGAAYLHILYYRYFKKVTNPKSRLYCSIAAYNTGAGNVAYAFNKNNGGRYSVNSALPVINSMSPDEVFRHMKSNLRYEEAKKYITNVSEKMKDY